MNMRIAEIAIITVIQFLWLYLLGWHHGVTLILFSLLIFLMFSDYVLQSAISSLPWYLRAVIGVFVGFLGGIAATFMAEIALRGEYSYLREYPLENLYYFPTLIMGWLYGARASVEPVHRGLTGTSKSIQYQLRSIKPFIPIGAAFPLITSASMRAEPQAKVNPSAPCPTFSHKLP